jgi:peroxiredoxin
MLIALLALALAAPCAGTLAGEAAPDEEAMKLFREGAQALMQKKPDEAIAKLEQVAKKVPNEPAVSYYLAKAYLLKKDEKAAFNAFTQSVKDGLLGSLESLVDIELSPSMAPIRNSPEYAKLVDERVSFGDAPELAAKDLDGKDVKLSDLRGKPVLLVFWRLGCSYCDSEFSSLQKSADKLKESGLVIVGAASDPVDQQKALIKKLGLSFAFWRYDPTQRMLPLLYGLSTSGTPASFFIARDGRIARFYQGFPRDGDFSYPVALIAKNEK